MSKCLYEIYIFFTWVWPLPPSSISTILKKAWLVQRDIPNMERVSWSPSLNHRTMSNCVCIDGLSDRQFLFACTDAGATLENICICWFFLRKWMLTSILRHLFNVFRLKFWRKNKEVKVSFSGEKLNPCINLLTRKGELPSENFSRDERRSN